VVEMIINSQNKTVNPRRRYGVMSRKGVMFVVVLAAAMVGGVAYAASPDVSPPRDGDPIFAGVTLEELCANGQMDPTMFAQVILGETPPYAASVNNGAPAQNDETIPDWLTGLCADGQMDPAMFAQVILGETPPYSMQ
jgi:hypothetical protein